MSHDEKSIVSVALMGVFVHAANAETWYFTKASVTKGYGWASASDRPDPGPYWTNSQGETGSGDLIKTDFYCHKGGLRLRAVSEFGGGSLTIGDLSDPNYATHLCMDGSVSVSSECTLTLAVGYAAKNSSSDSTYWISNPIVTAPKEKPFGFTSNNSNVPVGIKGSLTGATGVGLVIGGRYTGEAISRASVTNVLYTLSCGLANYHGTLYAVSAQGLPSATQSNVKLAIPVTDSDASLEMEAGVELQQHSTAGEIKLSNLTPHVGSRICFAYTLKTTTMMNVRVTELFSIPEDEGTVQIRFSGYPAARTDDQPLVFPLITVPSGQPLDDNRFEIVNVETRTVDETPILRVVEDNDAGTKSLVAVFLGKGHLITSDSDDYTGKKVDHSTRSSALTNAVSWSDGRLPHADAIYEFGDLSGYGSCIRTPFCQAEDYVFPGKLLRTVGSSATFLLADDKTTTVNLVLTTPLSLRVANPRTPTLAGTIQLGANDVTQSSWNGSELTVASKLSGTGNWLLVGVAGTGSPHSKLSFTADNSDWKGTLYLSQSVNTSSEVPSTGSNKHQKLGLVHPRGLGGALDEMNYAALTLAQYSELIVTNSVTLTNDLNRGIYITNVATFTISKDCDFTCNWPLTFNGKLRKVGAGMLSLGGVARFGNPAEGVLDAPPSDEIERKLAFGSDGGSVRALRHDCVNGLTIDFASGTKLVLDFNPADADLKRYGFFNVKTDTPFVEGETINLELLNVDAAILTAARQTDAGYKQGLVTVKTSAADNVAANLAFTKVSGLRVVREDDSETGYTTFSAYGKQNGTMVLVR